MTYAILPYFTLSLRHQLIEGLELSLSEEDFILWLEELDIPPPVRFTSLKQALKQVCSHLFQSKSESLLALLEQMVQLDLYGSNKSSHIEYVNGLLPPGVEFSLVSGRLLVFTQDFQSPYYAEESHLWGGSQVTASSSEVEDSTATPSVLANIQNRRLKLLENVHTGNPV